MLLEISIIGVVASLIMEGVKKIGDITPFGAKVSIVAISIVLGGGYYFLKDTNAWESILGVLASASTFYAFFLKKVQPTV